MGKPSTCSFDTDGLRNVEIIVTQRNGEVRTAMFDPSVSWNEDELLLSADLADSGGGVCLLRQRAPGLPSEWGQA